MIVARSVPVTPGARESWLSVPYGGTVLVRKWAGDPAAVGASLAAARARGQLVRWERLPARRGEAAVRVVLRPVLPRSVRGPRPRTVAALAVAGVLVTAAAVGSTVWAVWLAVAWVVAHWLTIVGTVAGVLVVWALLGMAGKCPGIHCPGCGCR